MRPSDGCRRWWGWLGAALLLTPACGRPWSAPVEPPPADTGDGSTAAPEHAWDPSCVLRDVALFYEEQESTLVVLVGHGTEEEDDRAELVVEHRDPDGADGRWWTAWRTPLPDVSGLTRKLPFEPGDEYVARVGSPRCGYASDSLTLAAPLEDPEAVVGQAYAAPGDSFVLDFPTFFGGSDPLVERLHMVWLPLVTFDRFDGGTFEASLGWPDVSDPAVPAQKTCTSTVPITGTFTNPQFRSTPTDLRVISGGGATRIYGAEVSGTFDPDGTTIRDVVFLGSVDLRDLAMEYDADVSDLCDTLATATLLGHGCVACPDGEDACTSVLARGVTATLHPAVTLTSQDCGVDDALARWDHEYSSIYAADAGEASVRALGFDGAPAWEQPVGAPILNLQFVPDGADWDLVARHDDGTATWLDRRTGTVLDRRPLTDADGAQTGDLIPVAGGYVVGGFGSTRRFYFEWACSVLPLGAAGLPLGWIGLPLLVARRRPRNQSSPTR